MAKQLAIVLAVALLVLGSLAAKPGIKFHGDSLSVSGISAGAFMAVQYEVAFSKQVHGAAIIAGGPFLCAMGSFMGTTDCMYSPELLSQAELVAATELAAAGGDIDPISAMADDTVYLFSGILDSLVNQGTMKLLASIYTSNFGVNNVTTFFDFLAEHAWITNDYGNSCITLGAPYINNCGLDFAGNFLAALFANTGHKWVPRKGVRRDANLYTFDAGAFGADPWINSLASTSILYIPEHCLNGTVTCHLHIAFHGCEMNIHYISDDFVRHTELDMYAETNNIVILYPQADSNDLKENPNGCFDWWGYNGGNYAFQSGAQLSIVNAIAQSLLNGTVPALSPYSDGKHKNKK